MPRRSTTHRNTDFESATFLGPLKMHFKIQNILRTEGTKKNPCYNNIHMHSETGPAKEWWSTALAVTIRTYTNGGFVHQGSIIGSDGPSGGERDDQVSQVNLKKLQHVLVLHSGPACSTYLRSAAWSHWPFNADLCPLFLRDFFFLLLFLNAQILYTAPGSVLLVDNSSDECIAYALAVRHVFDLLLQFFFSCITLYRHIGAHVLTIFTTLSVPY
jgi:hypothetical protein